MSSVYTGNLTVSIFGQSHAPAIGVTIDGLPAGFPINLDELQFFLSRRAPGQNAWSTPRREVDAPEVLCGLKNGKTCGAPLTAIIRNTNTRSGDYENLRMFPALAMQTTLRRSNSAAHRTQAAADIFPVG